MSWLFLEQAAQDRVAELRAAAALQRALRRRPTGVAAGRRDLGGFRRAAGFWLVRLGAAVAGERAAATSIVWRLEA